MKAVLLAMLTLGCYGEVADASAGGFTVKSSWTVAAEPSVVYQKFVGNVGDWWNPAHTYSGDAHNLSLDPASRGGCLCEKLPNNGSVRHLEVVFVSPGKVLRM